MAVTQTFLDALAATLRITRLEPPLAEIGQYLRFGIGSDPGFLRAVDPTLVTSAVAGTIGGTVAGPLAATLAIPVEVPVKLTVAWRATRLVPIRVLSPGAGGSATLGAGRGPIRGPGAARPAGRPSLAERFHMAFGGIEASSGPPYPEVFEELALVADDGFLAPDGVNLPDVAFLFAPSLGKMHANRLPMVDTIHVYAEVTLEAGETKKTVPLGPVKVLLPVLPVPRLLALFRYPEFNLQTEDGKPRNRQAVLLVVPAGSPLGSFDQLQNTLRTLRAALAPLYAIRRFARMLLGVHLLSGALSRRPRLRYLLRDQIKDLSKVKLITVRRWQDPWVNDAAFPELNDTFNRTPGLSDVSLDPPDISVGEFSYRTPDIGATPGDNADNDIDADNRMSSLIFIGPPSAKAECFIKKNFKNGRLVVTAGPEAVVMIPSLAYPEGESAVETDPDDRAVVGPPPSPEGGGFDQRISSLKM